MALKYSKAPISELVCGFILNKNLLLSDGVLFKAIGSLSKDYPIINTHPITSEEEVINDTIQSGIDYAKAGFSTYRLVDSQGRWHILLQQNLLTFHWVRQDIENVGNYPGFAQVFERFHGLYSYIRSLFKDPQIFDSSIKSYYLSYADRVNLEEYKKEGLSIGDIINLSPPFFTVNDKKYFANNYFNRYSIPCDAIGGYSLASINSPTIPGIGQILAVDNKLKGFSPGLSKIEDWFNVAHEIQVSFFESLFKPEILNKWR